MSFLRGCNRRWRSILQLLHLARWPYKDLDGWSTPFPFGIYSSALNSSQSSQSALNIVTLFKHLDANVDVLAAAGFLYTFFVHNRIRIRLFAGRSSFKPVLKSSQSYSRSPARVARFGIPTSDSALSLIAESFILGLGSSMMIPDSERMLENGDSCLPCTPEEEKRTISELTSKAESNSKEAHVFYVVSNWWYVGWQRYVGDDVDSCLSDCSTDNGGADMPTMPQRPGPIDNTDLLVSVNQGQHFELELRTTG